MESTSLITIILLSCPLVSLAHMIRSANPGPNPPLAVQENVKGPTTPNISAIFIGRCLEDTQCLQQDQCSPKTLQGTCDELWSTFVDAFANKDPCQAGYNDYDDVINAAMPATEEDETLFWSGIPLLALNNGRVTRSYTILEETLPGYIANGLTWCGKEAGSSGIDFVKPCPARCATNNETMYTFWRAASRAFARQAKGMVAVALNGSRTDAFRYTSTFATNELPNLNRANVTHVNILLVYDIAVPGNNQRARCNEGSIGELQSLLTSEQFSYTCIEGPMDFKFLQCAGDPMNDRCMIPGAGVRHASGLVALVASLGVHLLSRLNG